MKNILKSFQNKQTSSSSSSNPSNSSSSSPSNSPSDSPDSNPSSSSNSSNPPLPSSNSSSNSNSSNSPPYFKSFTIIPLIEKSKNTIELLKDIGGSKSILLLINIFYQKMFYDNHLDQFVLNHNDPHFIRLGNWIIEKMGGEGNLWSNELKERSKCPVVINLPHIGQHIVSDRTSAHVAAWYCPKRAEKVIGNHFKLHDCRVWMRLMFWSARETHLFDNPTFESWFIRFIADYIPIYEQTAVFFVRESARWSLNPDNIQRYLDSNNTMEVELLGVDGTGVPFREALKSIPREEANDRDWPYNVVTDDY